MIYPTKTVEWTEVVEWCRKLARSVEDSGWRPDVIIAIGRGGLVVSRILGDLLQVDRVLPLLVKWHELNRREGETYLAELIRAYARAHESGCSPDTEITEYVKTSLRVRIDFEQNADLSGMRALLVEEISATGVHLGIAKEMVKNRWRADEVRTAALVWKAPSVMGPDVVRVDYYVVKPAKFVWFQFPWSRLGDYVQFLRVMLSHESHTGGKRTWPEEEVLREFKRWYGEKVDLTYFAEALRVLEERGEVKLERPSFSVKVQG